MILLVITILVGIYIMFLNKKSEVVDTLPKCLFEGEDLYNSYVHDKEGKIVKTNPINLSCSKCSDYVYRVDSESCIEYTHNKEYGNICVPKLGKYSTCPF